MDAAGLIRFLAWCDSEVVMPSEFQPSASELAEYLEQRGELTKPWNLQMLRLRMLKEQKASMSPEDYIGKIQEAHADLMRMGEFWKGREAKVFGGAYAPSALIEPLPGSPEDR